MDYAKRPTLKSNSKPVVVTMGDPRGIGPEIICKAIAHPSLKPYLPSFVVVGDKKLLRKLDPCIEVIDITYRLAGEGALKFLDKAIDLIKKGSAHALVTAPLSKEAVSRHAKNFVGHTEYLAKAFDVEHVDMMFVAGGACLTIVTRHVPLKKVPGMITQQAVFNSIELMHRTLQTKFKIRSPQIAVLGLNPHAGEGGLLGTEDAKQILPAIVKAQKLGIKARGPLPADTFFAFPQGSHGIISMYHDQGLAPFKGLHMKELVNFTAGLPFIRTSPAHGTAFDIAGKNIADPSSMLAALALACKLA